MRGITIVVSSLKVCMVKKYILNFVVTPRNFILLRIESFAIIKLRGVTAKFKI